MIRMISDPVQSLSETVQTRAEKVHRSIRYSVPILSRLVLRAIIAARLAHRCFPFVCRDIRNFSTISRVLSPRVSRTTTIGRIPKLEISPLSLIPKRQSFRQTKDFNEPNSPLALLAKILRKNIVCTRARARIRKQKTREDGG